jgi:hypothetical protein
VTIAEGDGFFANWADFPGVVEAGDGVLIAHWLGKTAEETYAYSVFLARSEDGGVSWRSLGKLNKDDTPTEHGFVSFVPEERGARAFWLDGREMIESGSMTLRTAIVGVEVGSSEVLDERICECCSTGAAVTNSGPIVVYRDRSEIEVRDIALVRRESTGWSAPGLVHADGWWIEGCPVNGPQLASQGDKVAVAWFTAAEDQPAVRLAFSPDAGKTFLPPVVVDDVSALGRVDIEFGLSSSAWVSWLARRGDRAEVRLAEFDRSGSIGEGIVVGGTAVSRSSGVPRLARLGDTLFAAWVEVQGDDRYLRVSEIPIPGVSDDSGVQGEIISSSSGDA